MELRILYTKKTKKNAPWEIISHIAGYNREGNPWMYPTDQAIEIIKSGNCMFYVERPLGHKNYVVIASGKGGNCYLKTKEDETFPNYLLCLPEFPPYLNIMKNLSSAECG